MGSPEFAVDVEEALGQIAALSLLSEDVRRLIASSFEPVAYGLGDVIVREGDPADAFYLLVDGSARVVKRGTNGDEVALNVLHGGDTFGEMALLEDTTRLATIRASGRVEALRLDSAVFSALTRSHPEVRSAFVVLANERALWNFLRVHSSFSRLPDKALALLCSDLERVEFAAGEVVIDEGDPPGAMYVIEEGRARVFRRDEQGDQDLGYLRNGDFFGERSLFLTRPRDASVQAVTECRLLRLQPELFSRLLEDFPAFRARVEQRIEQYDYRRLARVPLDFAEEILPAEALACDVVSPDRAEPLERQTSAFAGAVEYEETPQSARRPRVRTLPARLPARRDGLRRRLPGDGLPLLRPGGRASRTSARPCTRRRDGTSLAGITRGAAELGLEARSVRASKSKLDELPLPAIVHWEGNHWVVLYAVDDRHVRVADPARGLRRIPRAEFLEKWTGYASLIRPTERLAQMPESKPSLRWLEPFVRPHRRSIAIASLLACVAAGLELVLPDPDTGRRRPRAAAGRPQPALRRDRRRSRPCCSR